MANENKATGEKPQAEGEETRLTEDEISGIEEEAKRALGASENLQNRGKPYDQEDLKSAYGQEEDAETILKLIAAWRTEKNAYEILVEAISEISVSKCIDRESSQYVCIGEDEWENIRMLAGQEQQ